MTHIYVGNLTIIGPDNGLSPGRRQAIIWNNAGILLIGPLGTNFSQILIEIHKFSFTKMRLKLSSAKWRPYCLGLNVLKYIQMFHIIGHICPVTTDTMNMYIVNYSLGHFIGHNILRTCVPEAGIESRNK